MIEGRKQAQGDQASGKRRRAMIEAAAAQFFAQGYAATTMSSIAVEVGGSKTTLWTYFPSKEDLFAAVVDDIVEHYGKALSVPLPLTEPLRPTIRGFGLALLASILSPPILDLHRLVVSEAKRVPHLARLFYERAPQRGISRLSQHFAQRMRAGELREGDPIVAACQFVALCKAGEFQRMAFDIGADDQDSAIAADVDEAVEAFMRIWAT